MVGEWQIAGMDAHAALQKWLREERFAK